MPATRKAATFQSNISGLTDNTIAFRRLVSELVAAKVDIIVTAGTPAALAVKQKPTTMPLVMVAVGDPVGTGLVQNLAHPGAISRD